MSLILPKGEKVNVALAETQLGDVQKMLQSKFDYSIANGASDNGDNLSFFETFVYYDLDRSSDMQKKTLVSLLGIRTIF